MTLPTDESDRPMTPAAPRRTAVWFRTDLRVEDNPALYHACQSGGEVMALFIFTPQQWRRHHVSARRLALMAAALQALQRHLAQLGIPLHCHSCPDFAAVPAALEAIIRSERLTALAVNREYAWDEVRRDQAVAGLCARRGVHWHSWHASTVAPPGSVLTRQGSPYKVFTPFRRSWLERLALSERDALPLPAPRAAADPLAPPGGSLDGAACSPLTSGLAEEAVAGWPADEASASQRLDRFLEQAASRYHHDRDVPALDATSRLSPCLTLGILSPRQCLHRARLLNDGAPIGGRPGLDAWINELIWRDFYLHVVHAFPQVCRHLPFRAETDRVAWRRHAGDFAAWCDGATGYPLVDAAMHQLNETGWMHNRLRMVTAMFLSKYLLIDWRLGERYFMERLIDGHFPSNNGGWQWSASTGTDAAPYFRLLSPVRQAQRFDPDAAFIRRFLPRLSGLPAKLIHQPGHPALLSTGYPAPMVDLSFARARCLAAFKAASSAAPDE